MRETWDMQERRKCRVEESAAHTKRWLFMVLRPSSASQNGPRRGNIKGCPQGTAAARGGSAEEASYGGPNDCVTIFYAKECLAATACKFERVVPNQSSKYTMHQTFISVFHYYW